MSPSFPFTDTSFEQRYARGSLEQKVENKVALQRALNWVEEPRMPLLCLPLGMTEELGGTLLKSLMPGLLSLPLSIVIRGKGSKVYGAFFTTLAKDHRHRIAILPDEESAVRAMVRAADVALFFSHPSEAQELLECLRHGTVPIAPGGAPLLFNYDPVEESGNAFLYEEKHGAWGCFAALVRALETYRLPFDWRTIQLHCVQKATRQSP